MTLGQYDAALSMLAARTMASGRGGNSPLIRLVRRTASSAQRRRLLLAGSKAETARTHRLVDSFRKVAPPEEARRLHRLMLYALDQMLAGDAEWTAAYERNADSSTLDAINNRNFAANVKSMSAADAEARRLYLKVQISDFVM